MDILNKFGTKISRQFSNLTTDASPSYPRVYNTVPTDNAENSPSVDIEDVSETFCGDASPIITDPPDTPPIPPLRRKGKKKMSQESSQKESPQQEELKTEFQIPPVNTQASGSVINIINSSGVHWGPEVTYNFGAQFKPDMDVKPEPEPAVTKTKQIVALMESKEEIEHEYMDIVSKNLGSGWRTFFGKLGYKDGMLDLFYESHQHKGIPEVIYQILLDWTRTGKRTLGKLCATLWKEGKKSLVRDIADLKNSSNDQAQQSKFDLD